VMLTKTCSGCFSCRKSAKTKFLQVIGQLKQPVQHYIYATTKERCCFLGRKREIYPYYYH
ncbi:MAG: hypothetical protein ACKVTZ_16000, partial [Bacteroidia bacterium]